MLPQGSLYGSHICVSKLVSGMLAVLSQQALIRRPRGMAQS
jgi:hypothetical protein